MTSKLKARKASSVPLRLQYNLNELPSAQHRAGLAGLLLMLRWLEKRSKRKGVCRVIETSPSALTLELDETGLAELLDAVYGAKQVERSYSKPFKNKAPLREEINVTADKKGNKKEKTSYVYPVVVPSGAFLAELDPSPDKLWLKLWRDFIWNIMRGVPATRRPFEERATGTPPTDVGKVWNSLISKSKGIALPSTFYLGAQAKNAEEIPFKDRSRVFFLLHFWPYVCQLFVPRKLNIDGKPSYQGYAVSVPDVADLGLFCEVFAEIQNERSEEASGYRPRGAIIDLVEESGLESVFQIRKHARARSDTSEAVCAVDVFHVEKQGKSIRTLLATRVDPDDFVLDEYTRCRQAYWHSSFRKQRLRNALNGDPWHTHFGAICSTFPAEQVLGNYFRRDAREAFTKTEVCQVTKDETPDSIEKRIYRIVGSYLGQQLDKKHDIRWADSESKEDKDKYSEKKRDLARKAFLAVRSRTGTDFIEYFVSTLCSVPQRLSESGFSELASSLHQQTELVRTLTLLALSARG